MRFPSIPGRLAAMAAVAALITAVVLPIATATAARPRAGTSAKTTPRPQAATTTVTTRHNKVGTFLVGPNGRTLYLWEADPPNKSKCTGQCVTVWPPLMLSGRLKATGGVKASLLGSIRRAGGRQVTYAGHPLYYYSSDTKPGQTTGEGSDSFGALWEVVATSGKAIK